MLVPLIVLGVVAVIVAVLYFRGEEKKKNNEPL
jgi:mannose/fructose/N-acetylgalactosamine-specific phosphotransferase system component IIC